MRVYKWLCKIIIVLLIYFIQCMSAPFIAGKVVVMLQEEPREEDEEAICPGSQSDTAVDDDPDYLPECQAGDVGVSGNPALLHKEDLGFHSRSDMMSPLMMELRSSP